MQPGVDNSGCNRVSPKEPTLVPGIEAPVRTALAKLFERDADLLRNDVNERSITHKLAEYLQAEFHGWQVDCEYNRNHDKTKTLKHSQRRTVRINNTDAVSVFPDIIVHQRETDRNLLVIEVKQKTSRESSCFDIKKLCAFKEELRYKHALFLELKTGICETVDDLRWI
jgi:hypothetical protein